MTELLATYPNTTPLARDEARALTDEVRGDAERLWLKLLRLYNGAAHLALGYRSWGAYFEAEFGGSRSRAYQLLEAARVVESVQSVGLEPPQNDYQARELVPLLKDEQAVVEAWREVKNTYGDKATAVDVKRVVTNRLKRIEREDEAARRRLDATPNVTYITDDLTITHANLTDLTHDLNGTIDAIITDPPYPGEYIPVFDDLGELAARLLKPNGVLVAMVGQTHLPEYIMRLSAHLTYRWCGAYLTDGPATRIHGRGVGTKWKPLLIFGGKGFITQDVFASNADDKEHHHWGQSESGIADIVSRLTKPGDLVCDPFLGGGTTAIVCRDLGRRFVGCDIDAAAVNTTLERLAA